LTFKFAFSALATAALLGALAGSATASALYSYLAVQASEVDFVQLTVSQTDIVGVLYYDTLSGSPPSLAIIPHSITLTGTDQDGHLTVYFAEHSTPLFGSMNAGSLSLEVPQTNGMLGTFTFHQSSVGAYNQVLAAWSNKVNQANRAAAQAQAKARATAQRHKQLLTRLNNSITAADENLAVMRSPGTLSDDLGVVDDDLGVVQDDLATVHDDNSTLSDDIAAGSGHSTLCSDVTTEYQDAANVVADTNALINDAKSNVGPDLGQDHNAIVAAPAYWAAYWSAQRALPTYHPTTPIPPLKVAIAEGKVTIAQALAHINNDIRQANTYIAQAYAMPNAAQHAMHCGPIKTPPTLPTLRWNGSELVAA
jgi:hypothetical protein